MSADINLVKPIEAVFNSGRAFDGERIGPDCELPSDGAVIISPNHTNTLMDALVILQSRRDRTVFAARADIFRKPRIAAILRFLKILPMARSRDTVEEIAHTREILREIDS